MTTTKFQGSSKALATVTSIIDGTGSIGAAVGPFIASALAPANKHGNWDAVFYALMAADVLALLLVFRLVKHEIQDFIKNRRRPKTTQL